MKEMIDRDLLIRYMRKECNAAESVQVKNFLLQPEWQQALEELLEEDFNKFYPEQPAEGLSTTWNQRFQQTRFPTKERSLWRTSWIGYAAACLIMIGIGLYQFKAERLSKTSPAIAMLEKINTRGQRSKITLPDNSIIYLGAESKVRFPEKFGTGNREISLSGEAFFEVAKDSKHPFIVYTGAVQTEVLGTSFKIDAFTGKHITVAVATGKVRVARKIAGSNTLNALAILQSGKEMNWNPANQKATVGEADPESLTAWKDGTMTFVAAPLSSIAEQLERHYNVKIRFDQQSSQNYHISLIVKGTDPINHALEIICNTTHLQFSNSGDNYIISKIRRTMK